MLRDREHRGVEAPDQRLERALVAGPQPVEELALLLPGITRFG